MYFKYSGQTQRFVDTWLELISRDSAVWDQNAFNDLARAGWDPVAKLHPANKRVFIGFNGSLAVGVLPVASFSGGCCTYFCGALCMFTLVCPAPFGIMRLFAFLCGTLQLWFRCCFVVQFHPLPTLLLHGALSLVSWAYSMLLYVGVYCRWSHVLRPEAVRGAAGAAAHGALHLSV